jgi:uncharacterized protein (DUF1501 family)
MFSRRFFLRGSAIAMAGMGGFPAWLGRAAAAEGRKRKTLVAIFQRGAADGLNIVAPFGDKRYRELRPTLALNPPITAPAGTNAAIGNAMIDLDGFFALNSIMAPLKPLWDQGQLGIVQATGSPDPSRSHFDAQDHMESGTPGASSGDGWLNRALRPQELERSPLRAVSMGNQVARTLRGAHDAIAIGNQTFNVQNAAVSSVFESMYGASSDPQWGRAGKEAFDAMKLIKSVNQGQPDAATTQLYAQGGELGRNLQQVARLIKADAGLEAAFAEINGWDHHSNEQVQLTNLLRQFSSALAAFAQDLGDRMEDVVLVTMSEFGRTAEENGNGGTDHGHGSMMMVLGGPVQGGKVHGKWPGLEKEQLFEGRDLAVTTDYRAVLSELIVGHLGQKNIGSIFPGFQMGDPLGLLKA